MVDWGRLYRPASVYPVMRARAMLAFRIACVEVLDGAVHHENSLITHTHSLQDIVYAYKPAAGNSCTRCRAYPTV